jgi:hypothetical protein
VFCHIFTNFWRKIKVDSVLESGESCSSIWGSGKTAMVSAGPRRLKPQAPSLIFCYHFARAKKSMSFFAPRPKKFY